MIASRARTLRFARTLGPGDDAPIERDGRAPCLVAFHGFGGTTAELAPLLASVADAGFAVRAPHLPGHGTTVTELQEHSFDSWVEAARDVVRGARAAYGRVVVAGFSMGSLVATELASEVDLGAEGLIVLGNAVTLSPILALPLALFERFGIAMPDWYLVKPRAADIRDRIAMARITTYDRHPLRAAFHVYRAGRRAYARAPLVRCPTLILHGAHDHVCPAQNARRLAHRVGTHDVTVRIYDDSAHLVACDHDREAVARDVVTFLERIERSRTADDHRGPA